MALDEAAFLLLLGLLPGDVVIRDVADRGRVGLNALDFGVVGDLRVAFGLRRLELGVILNLRLILRVLGQPLHLGRVRDDRGLGLGHVSAAVGQLVKALVVPHGEGHVALLTLEAGLVPHLLEAFELLGGVDGLVALGALLIHILSFTLRIKTSFFYFSFPSLCLFGRNFRPLPIQFVPMRLAWPRLLVEWCQIHRVTLRVGRKN